MKRARRTDLWFLAALLALGVIATADMLDPTNSLVGALAVAPFLASATCTPARTAVVSALSVLFGSWSLATHAEAELTTTAVRIGVLVSAAVLAPLVASQRVGRERRLQDLTHVAEVAQLAVLTPIPPVAGPARLASAYESASREALIGGDLYGVVETERGIRLMVGDVRGKGIDAVRTAAVALAAFRDGTQQERPLTEVARHCDRQLRRHLVDEDFVTAVFAELDDEGGLEIVSCGHPAPLLARGDHVLQLEIRNPRVPLGLPSELDSGTAAEHLRLHSGDRILFYTDGLAEARDAHGAFVDLGTMVADIGTTNFDEVLDTVLTRLHDAALEVRDDLALVLVEYTRPVSQPCEQPRAAALVDDSAGQDQMQPDDLDSHVPGGPASTIPLPRTSESSRSPMASRPG